MYSLCVLEGTFVHAGWGTTSENGLEYADELNKDFMPWVSDEKCDQLLKVKGDSVEPQEICAGYYDGGHDACTGDSVRI